MVSEITKVRDRERREKESENKPPEYSNIFVLLNNFSSFLISLYFARTVSIV